MVELSMKAKPATTFRDCFSTFVSVKPLFCCEETGGTISSHVCGDQSLCFYPKHTFTVIHTCKKIKM